MSTSTAYELHRDRGRPHSTFRWGRFGFLQSETVSDIGGEKAGILPVARVDCECLSRSEDRWWFPGETVIIGIGPKGTLPSRRSAGATMPAILATRGKDLEAASWSVLPRPRTVELHRIAPVVGCEVPGGRAEDCSAWCQRHARGHQRALPPRLAQHAAYSFAGKTGTPRGFTVARPEKYTSSRSRSGCVSFLFFAFRPPPIRPRISLALAGGERRGWRERRCASTARCWTLHARADGKLSHRHYLLRTVSSGCTHSRATLTGAARCSRAEISTVR